MELLLLCLVLMGALLISAALEPFLPRVSLPLVQILIGILLYLFVELPANFTLDSNLFLVLFIAPLLFDESRNADNRELWKHKGSIVSLAIGLVFITLLVVGFMLHWIAPSVPLAAAFALGAALGPTDAVAVASLGKEVKLSPRQKTLLTGEALLNDASGVVSLQFAVAAAVTGAFSVWEASLAFFVEFFGGILIGVVIAVIAYFIVKGLRRAGVESVTFHVCYEVFLPFFSYIVASQTHIGDFHFSGILAVVATGLVFTWMPQVTSGTARRLTTFSAQVNIASHNIWSMLSFIFNGVVFVYLGFMLPSTIYPAIEETALSTPWIIGIALVVTAIIIVVRFVWVVVLDLVSKDPETNMRAVPRKHFIRNALVTTLAGPKGAVSLSLALTIPATLASGESMPVRDFLLFLICATIILTLLLANFIVPVLSPKDEENEEENDMDDTRAEIEIVDNVIRALREQRNDQNRRAIFAVIRGLNERKASLQRDVASSRQLRFLRQEVLVKQEEFIRQQMEMDAVDTRVAERYLKRIDRMKNMLKSRRTVVTGSQLQNTPLASQTSTMQRIQRKVTDSTNFERRRCEFKIGIEQVAVDYLKQVVETDDKERIGAAKALLTEHQPLLATLKARLAILDAAEGITDDETLASGIRIVRSDTGSLHIDRDERDNTLEMIDEIRAEALRLELDEIQTMRDAGKISNATAKGMREEVYLLQMSLNID